MNPINTTPETAIRNLRPIVVQKRFPKRFISGG